MQYKVELLEDGIIYVEKLGDQTAESLTALFAEIQKLAAELRAQGKPVLILSNAQKEANMDEATREVAMKIGKELDYDKSATYTSSAYLHNLRDVMVQAAKLDQKVASFETKAEALAWLLY